MGRLTCDVSDPSATAIASVSNSETVAKASVSSNAVSMPHRLAIMYAALCAASLSSIFCCSSLCRHSSVLPEIVFSNSREICVRCSAA